MVGKGANCSIYQINHDFLKQMHDFWLSSSSTEKREKIEIVRRKFDE